MIKLPFPADNHSVSLDLCLSDLSESKLAFKFRLSRAKTALEMQSEAYSERATSLELHDFEPSRRAHPEAKIPFCGGEVSKGDLVDLYKNTFSKEGTASRSIYNRIKLSSKEKCTICLVSEAETLDHYLPKARYPAFSVDPQNLIPACTKCNKGKGASLLTTKEEHVLHPYFSPTKFYDEPWLKAEIVEDIPVKVRFFVDPPNSWCDDEVTLLERHFEEFDLADKFALFVAHAVVTEIDTVDLSLNRHGLSVETIQADFVHKASNRPSVNSPIAAMYRAMSQSRWFCSEPRQHEENGYI
ncbi:HNH endonuclease [Vibrio breoganii]